ncbi:dynamin family protein [Brevibacillus dissolubilis]|uniref:dynamin family protein n=1 Tax=Brevibacillus dissolubilis TaxID=1844116 RepID=UPI001115B95F|nr:dynamin family protein [Brevibacillus dissolubilis]
MNQVQMMERPVLLSDLASRMERMAEAMKRANDNTHAVKLQQLIDKTRNTEMSIAFCGHFSAGKSTMINTLLGKELLPSNPIPTSANVVKIRGGEAAARVYTRNSGVLTFDPDTEMEALKKYAIDGDTVEWVEICYPGLFLDEKSSLLDTPGIDSTDAAHKVATESALHLADVVIYMMDYNHVQAEENFNFTKTLKDRNKPVYLVINMIDKHVDFELDFDSYKESVEEAFATWNIKPDGIFYTSLAEPDHLENQYEEFRAKLIELFGNREQLLADSVYYSAEALIDEHQRYLARENGEKRNELEAKLVSTEEEMDANDEAQIRTELAKLEGELSKLEGRVSGAQAEMEKELTSLLDNARLTYFSTNEAAAKYLETRKPGFKVGFLFGSSKKTEEERQARLQALLDDFQDKVSAHLDWHFKELLSKMPEKYGVRDESLHAEVHGYKLDVTADFLADQVKEGAGTSEYVLNYAKDISNGIKLVYRREGFAFIEKLTKRIKEQMEKEASALRPQLAKLRELADIHEALAKLGEQEKAAGDQLRAILTEGE